MPFEETHIDHVFIGPKYTYKVKKPVKFSFVDYSTLAKRKHFCREEVRLNRRYSPSVYLGYVPMKNSLGETFEYAVKMKTFAGGERVDKLLHKNRLSMRMVDQIAQMIADFHLKAPSIHSAGSPVQLKKIVVDTLNNIDKFGKGNLSSGQLKRIKKFLLSFLSDKHLLFLQRIKNGKIKDLHGDLHTENIFYHKKPYLLDCVEFNADLRRIDVAAEISFILMDIEFRGRPDLALELLKAYLNRTGDFKALPLLNCYKCYYSCVRGMVSGMEGKHKLAKRYLRLALKYATRKPFIIAVGGIIGSGKSILAKALSETLGFPLLRSDQIRKSLVGTRVPRAKLYSQSFNQKTYAALFNQARRILKQGQSVILDASFSKRGYREKLKALAKASGVDYVFIETVLSKKEIVQRLKKRRGDISDAGPDLLEFFIKTYELSTDIPAGKKLSLSTAGEKLKVIEQLFQKKKLLSIL
ncbi:MAG: AAA family ATPase [Candidatus Saganbacteria bacterium]|nr:AAA family ATPase [Candidatus Saganbacteria bacterium]